MNLEQKNPSQLRYIKDWMLAPKATISHYNNESTAAVLSRFKVVLSSKLSLNELEMVVEAAALLQVTWTPGSTGEPHPFIELGDCLLSSFLSSYTECCRKPEQKTSLQELSCKVTELLVQCCDDSVTQNSLLPKLSGSLVSVVTNSNLEH